MLLVSDLHYTLKQFDWLVGVAADYDLVVVAGDLLDIRSRVEPDAQIVVVLEYLARVAAKTTVVVCSGNHDLNDRNELGERAAVWLDGARAVGRDRRRRARRDRRVLPHRLPVVGRAAHARAGRPRARRRRGTTSTGACGSGRTTRRPTGHRPAGPAGGTTATPISTGGSRCTGPTSSCAGTCTSRRSQRGAAGPIASAPRGW